MTTLSRLVEYPRFSGNNLVMKTMIGSLLLIALATPVIGLAQAQNASGSTPLKVTSRTFGQGGKIPKQYTCDSSNVSPPLRIENLPKTARSVALIVDDPDAPGRTWTHWLLWNIDPEATEIGEDGVPQNAIQGTSDFGSAKYGGPCPPSGSHRYYFKVYALDTTLSLPSSSKKAALEKAMAGHIVAEGSLMGTYSREH
jgi:Raf kinase inhibitor-like YbhB/YbcL family protein